MSVKAIVTNLGLAAASVATPTGPYIDVEGFEVATGFGYQPDRDWAQPQGSVVYSGPVWSYQNIAPKTINVKCRIPANVGPFEFGEIILRLRGSNAPFCVAVFDVPMQKTSGLTNVGSTFTFNMLINLEQSTAVFQFIDPELEPPILEVFKWSDIVPPKDMANPDIPTLLVRELDFNERSSFVHRSNDERWTIGTNYRPLWSGPITSATPTVIRIAQSAIPDLNPNAMQTNLQGKYVIDFENGTFRSVEKVEFAAGIYTFTLKPEPLTQTPAASSIATIYISTSSPMEFWELRNVPYANKTQAGIMVPTQGLYSFSNGRVEARGLVFDPESFSLGFSFNGLDNLRISGLYVYESLVGGPPGVTGRGQVWVSNSGSFCVQKLLPDWSPTGGPNNLEWTRVWEPVKGWGPWRTNDGSSGAELLDVNGYQTVAGLLHQWGRVDMDMYESQGLMNFDFHKPFSWVFNLSVTTRTYDNANRDSMMQVQNVTNTNFTIKTQGMSNNGRSLPGFYWTAFGIG